MRRAPITIVTGARRCWCSNLRSARLEPLVLDDLDRLRVRLAVHRELHHVRSGLNGVGGAATKSAATSPTATSASVIGWTSRHTEPTAATTDSGIGARDHRSNETPFDAVETRLLRAVGCAKRASLTVDDRDFHVVGGRFEVVVDRRAARRVLADKILLPADVRVVGEVRDVRDRRTRLEEVRVL